ncbi:MAG TPA: DHA2 family efflux MFS transporter permease subunit [Mizugakiibacter sp.]
MALRAEASEVSPNVATVVAAGPGGEAPARVRGLLWLISAAFFMQTLDSTIVNTAVPSIAQALAVPPLSIKTALTSYVLTLAICIPASPWLTDRFGTRRIFAAAIAVFTVGSLLCGLAQSLPQLVAARVVQGLGGALLLPVGRFVLVRSYGHRDFVAAMSTVATFGLLGSVLGPFLGGALSQLASWRWIFLVNVPAGLFGLWLNRREMPEFRRDDAGPFDPLGFALFALTSSLLLAVAELADARYARWPTIAALAAGALLSGALYVRHSRRVARPVIDLGLLRIRSVAVSLAGGLCTRLGVSGMFLLLVLFLQMGCGWSPIAAGLMMVPQALGAMLVKPLIHRLLGRYGYRRLLAANTVVVALLLVLFALPSAETPAVLIAAQVFVYGLVMSLQYTAMNTLTFVDLPHEHAAMASSMGSTVQYLAMSFGIALATLLMAVFLHGHAPADYVFAFRRAVLALGVLTLLAAAVFRLLRRDVPSTPASTP